MPQELLLQPVAGAEPQERTSPFVKVPAVMTAQKASETKP